MDREGEIREAKERKGEGRKREKGEDGFKKRGGDTFARPLSICLRRYMVARPSGITIVLLHHPVGCLDQSDS